MFKCFKLHLLHIVIAAFLAVSALPNCVSALSNLVRLIETDGNIIGIVQECWKLPGTLQ